ncbi:MAG: PAS domain S-box protein [Candidatus Saccharicenans sp.]|nr:PAS domain S-box protein [Candidatus Saccharicenans sp.]
MYISLILNVSLILALITLYSLILRVTILEKKAGKILTGLVFGLTAVAAMSIAYRYGSGLIYDGRSIMISLSGLYGGLWPATLASLISMAYRAHLGGNGIWAGLATIILSALTGLAFRSVFKSKINNLRHYELYGFGLAVHLVMLACQLLILPWPSGMTVISRIWLPILLIFPPATVLTGLMLQEENRRIRAESKLRESEEKYRVLFDNAGQLILVAQDGVLKLANKKALEYGYESEEIIGKPFLDFIHPDDRRMVWERHQKRLQEETFRPTYEFRFIARDGSVRWVEITAVKIDWEGRPATLNYVSDVTGRVMAEQEKEELLRVIENSQNEIYIFEPDTLKLSYANRAALDNTGYTLEELTSLTPLDLKPEFDRAKFSALLRPLLDGSRKKLLFETIHLRKDGSTYPVEVHLQLVQVAHKKSFLAIILDVTERKAAARNLEKTLQGIIRATARTVEVRDPYTAGHQERVAELAEAIAREMGLDDSRVQAINFASVIHDLGKIAVPPEILNKPGRLSDIEMELIKTHSQVGYDILKGIEFPWPVAEIILQHHEKIDGSGYPRGLKDGQILLEAKIICVADVIEAISSHRPYRAALGMEVALEEIRANAGKLYDRQVVEHCLNLIEKKGFTFSKTT